MLLIFLLLYFITFKKLKNKDINFRYSISPSAILLTTFFIYSIFGSLYILDKTSNESVYVKFWIIQLLSLLGIYLSLIFNSFSKVIPLLRKLPSGKVKLHFLTLSIIFLYIYTNQYGGLSSIFSIGYKLVRESEQENVMVYVIMAFIATFSLRFKMHNLIFISSFSFFIIAILLGTRGIAVAFIVIPIFSFYISNKRFSYLKLIYFIPVVIFFLILAYIRNIGFANVTDLLSLDYDFYFSIFIKNSEFITSGMVVYTGLTNQAWYSLSIFEYIFGVLVSPIPKAVWETRPEAISNLFSNKFAPMGEGIGFSIGYEAFLVFGWIGPLIYFFLIQRFLQLLYSSNKHYINSLYLISPLLILWVNRIDFQTIFKISLIYLLFCFFWRFYLKLID